VVHGEPGMDEVSPSGPTRIAELRDGDVRRYEVRPEELGLEPVALSDLAGGEPTENARIIERVLEGSPGAARSAVVANAAAALLVAGVVDGWTEGARLAEAVLDEGRAARALERLRAASHID
jgi:anthranilate phosphoribosyltransferase